MSRILEHINQLTAEIGPRGSTSAEEKKAAEYVESVLHSMGENIEVSTQTFKSPSTWSWTNAVSFLLVLIAVPLYLFSPILSAIFAGLTVLFFIAENDNRPILSRIMLKRESQNVIGKISPKHTLNNKVVIVAHIDSSRADYAHHPKRVAGFRKLVLLNLLLVFIIFAIFTIGTVTDFFLNVPLLPGRVEWLIALLLAIPVLYSMILVFLREWRYEIVPGANDNASGVGIVLELMKTFHDNPLRRTEVIAVLTGCEEVACNGMISFLNRYGDELQEAYLINIDNAGAGRPIFASVEGMFFSHKADPVLLKFARKVQSENPELEVDERSFRAGYTDGSAAMVRGYKVLSFLALNQEGVPPHWHWYSDTPENIEVKAVETVKEFIDKLIRVIDEEPNI